jgi:hypothetical protein
MIAAEEAARMNEKKTELGHTPTPMEVEAWIKRIGTEPTDETFLRRISMWKFFNRLNSWQQAAVATLVTVGILAALFALVNLIMGRPI